jgi:hypothetical protein
MSCKDECTACPFNIGHPECDAAYNLGCLPTPHEVIELKKTTGNNWACHSKPDQVCAGMVRWAKSQDLKLDFKSGELLVQAGVHCSNDPKQRVP